MNNVFFQEGKFVGIQANLIYLKYLKKTMRYQCFQMIHTKVFDFSLMYLYWYVKHTTLALDRILILCLLILIKLKTFTLLNRIKCVLHQLRFFVHVFCVYNTYMYPLKSNVYVLNSKTCFGDYGKRLIVNNFSTLCNQP